MSVFRRRILHWQSFFSKFHQNKASRGLRSEQFSRFGKRFLAVLLALSFFLCLASCSIDYTMPTIGESDKPEFIFKDASFSRMEGGMEKAVLYAGRIELYRSEDCMYGKDLSFVVYDSDGSVSVTGSCGLLSADTANEDYVFYDDVNITSYSQNLRVEADNVSWNGKTEQLVSAGVSPVRIYSGGFSGKNTSSITAELTGMGFSADGRNFEYIFAEGVSGTIFTEDSGSGK